MIAAAQHESGSTVAFALIIVLVIGVIAWLVLEAAVKAWRQAGRTLDAIREEFREKNSSDEEDGGEL